MSDAIKPAHERAFLDRYFGLRESGSDVRTEFIAGVTTFLTMVYIVFVNPQILGNAGMDKGAVFVATCIAAAVSMRSAEAVGSASGMKRDTSIGASGSASFASCISASRLM